MRTIFVLGEHNTLFASKNKMIPANRYIVGKTAANEKTYTLPEQFKGSMNGVQQIELGEVKLFGDNIVVDYDIISIWEPGCKPIPNKAKLMD